MTLSEIQKSPIQFDFVIDKKLSRQAPGISR